MKIVFLSTSGADQPSPHGRWLPIAHELAALGHSIELVALHPTFDTLLPSQRSIATAGVTVTHVAQMHVYGQPGQQRFFSAPKLVQVTAHATRMLLRAAVSTQPDAIHICKPQPMNALAGVLAARKLGVPLYLDCDDYEAEANRFGAAWQKWLVRFWEDRMPRHVRGITANTRYLLERNRVLAQHTNRLRLVPNGIRSSERSKPGYASISAIREKYELPKQTVAYLGAMSTIAHGVGLLLDAFRIVLNMLPGAKLLMIGDGEDRPALTAQAERIGIAKSIVWLGRVPRSETAAHVAAAACTVDPVFDLPAMRSRSPLKIIESMAAGVPVVTGDVGDRRETLQNGAAGVLVEAGQAQSLAAGLISILNDAAYRERLAAAAFARSIDYDWRGLSAHWATVYG